MNEKTESDFFTPEELANYLNVSRKFIDKQNSRGTIPGAYKVGRMWRYRKSEIEKRLLSGQLLLPNTTK